MRLVFTPTEDLVQALQQLYNAHEKAPKQVHEAPLKDIIEHFVEEAMQAFFVAPMEAIGAEGTVVNLIMKGVAVIKNTSTSLALRLLHRITREDQAGLVAHFKQLHFQQGEQHLIGFPLSSAAQAQVESTFTTLNEQGAVPVEALVQTFKLMADEALQHYMDNTVAAIEVKRFSRGLVRAARATIKKSTYVAIERGVPAMGVSFQQALVAYYQQRLIRL